MSCRCMRFNLQQKGYAGALLHLCTFTLQCAAGHDAINGYMHATQDQCRSQAKGSVTNTLQSKVQVQTATQLLLQNESRCHASRTCGVASVGMAHAAAASHHQELHALQQHAKCVSHQGALDRCAWRCRRYRRRQTASSSMLYANKNACAKQASGSPTHVQAAHVVTQTQTLSYCQICMDWYIHRVKDNNYSHISRPDVLPRSRRSLQQAFHAGAFSCVPNIPPHAPPCAWGLWPTI